MPFQIYIPCTPLDEMIEMLWYCEEPSPEHKFERLLPMGTVELVVNLAEDVTRMYDERDVTKFETMPGGVLAGMHTRHFIIDTAEQQLVMGVHFKPGGAYPFLGLPADELLNIQVSLEDLWGRREAQELRDRLLTATTVADKFAELEMFLLAKFFFNTQSNNKVSVGNSAVGYALNEFLAAPENGRVTDVIGRIGLSQRRFIELFRREVGTTPKTFCRILRFQQTIKTIQRLPGEIDWMDVALGCGYFDQPHFVHDFRSFAGITPTEYAIKKTPHLNHVPL